MASNYKKFTQIEHILARPDTYIGSIATEVDKDFVLAESGDVMHVRSVEYNPGLLKIFDEVLVNAIDQSTLDQTLDVIKVEVDHASGSISVYNSGKGIPVEKHQEYGVYIPELIFGQLLTSSNYDDTQERITGGRNGLGSKLTNVYSLKFEVEIVDPERKVKYKQAWGENMGKTGTPKVTTLTKDAPKGYVKITFWPDLHRFGLDTLGSGDNVAMMQRRVWDAAACTPSNVKVYWNGKMVPVKTFEKYVDMFVGSKTDAKRVYVSPHPRWEIVVAASQSGFKSVSFVNGIATTKGGSHVNYIVNQFIDGLKGLNKKKDLDIKPAYVKDHMFVFVKATLVNPTFSSQSKQECTSKVSSFGSRVVLDEDLFKKVAKLGILDEAVALARHRETREMNKTDGVKKTTIRGIPKLEDANKAGTKDSNRCTLVLTEGDSAKTFAISGMSVVGRDYWGVFPLRGKLLNVRDASPKQVMDNAEIQQLKQILGLQQGKEYSDVSPLRYGRIMVLTDADVDGSHIKGLIFNLFHHFWPSLLKLGFLCAMNTPVVKATKGAQTVSFHTLQEYEAWKGDTNAGSWKIRYYKGLGTSTAAEAREYFQRVEALTQKYICPSTEDEDSIVMAFKKDLSKERKGWIVSNTASPVLLDRTAPKVALRDFINRELVHFSIADVVRSIPSMVDGLKPSQRKVLYGCFKKNLDKEAVKVSQLAGYIGEVTAYHHGDASLQGTIVGMAQNFVGSNNINLLVPEGQFGTRLQGGKDAASARYIFTKLSPVSRKLFDPKDDPLLKYLNDDGYPIEPAYFVPTLPMVLINGATGIGTGFSTSVPSYNPTDIKLNIKRVLAGKPMEPMTPWYQGFRGTIEQTKPGTYVTKGVFTTPKPGWVHITELPVGTWTQDYKEWLEDDTKRKFDLVTYENHSTETDVLFKLQLRPDVLKALLEDDPHKTLNLTCTLHTTNMYLFDSTGAIKFYESPLDILADFVKVRTAFYKERKKHMLAKLTEEARALDERARFIRAVVSEELVIFKRPSAEIKAEMKASAYRDIEELLKIPIHNLTSEKIAALERECATKHEEKAKLEGTHSLQLWMEDLKGV